MHKIEYFTCNQRLIILFQTDTDISGSRFKNLIAEKRFKQ